MKIKQKSKFSYLLLLFVMVGSALSILSAPLAYADPISTKVTCVDGKKKTAYRTDKPSADVMDDKDFKYACRNNGGYKVIDETIVCKDNSMQNVYKSLADPKDELTQKDRQEACKGHGGIKVEDEPKDPTTEAGVDACDVKTSIIPVDCSTGGNPIWGLLLMAINILTAGIGIVAIGGIIYAAILWTTAEDKNAQIVKSKETIFNVVVGLVAFALLYAFLQFLIPGGVFNAGP